MNTVCSSGDIASRKSQQPFCAISCIMELEFWFVDCHFSIWLNSLIFQLSPFKISMMINRYFVFFLTCNYNIGETLLGIILFIYVNG